VRTSAPLRAFDRQSYVPAARTSRGDRQVEVFVVLIDELLSAVVTPCGAPLTLRDTVLAKPTGC